MIANIFVHENDLVVDRGRECVGLRKEMILGIVFDRANKGCLLPWRQILVMGYFLRATENVRATSTEDVNFGLSL